MRQRLIVWTIIVVAGSLAAAYIANTLLYLTPPNPVKARHLVRISRLAHPLFVQNWHLFAPDPVRLNHVLTVRCRSGDRVTAWSDVTTPMLKRHHRSRTSPMSRLLRVHQNAIRFYMGWTPDEWRSLLCRRDPQAAACRPPVGGPVRESGAYLLRRLASGTCDGMVGVGLAQAIQMRVLVHQPPPWSRRDRPDADGHTRSITLPWMPYHPR